MSEFGHQSWPSFAAYQGVTEHQDWAYNSSMSQFRCSRPSAKIAPLDCIRPAHAANSRQRLRHQGLQACDSQLAVCGCPCNASMRVVSSWVLDVICWAICTQAIASLVPCWPPIRRSTCCTAGFTLGWLSMCATTDCPCRMRHPDGIQQMLNQMRMHFKMPPEKDPLGRPEQQSLLFQRFIYLSQVSIVKLACNALPVGCLHHLLPARPRLHIRCMHAQVQQVG